MFALMICFLPLTTCRDSGLGKRPLIFRCLQPLPEASQSVCLRLIQLNPLRLCAPSVAWAAGRPRLGAAWCMSCVPPRGPAGACTHVAPTSLSESQPV